MKLMFRKSTIAELLDEIRRTPTTIELIELSLADLTSCGMGIPRIPRNRRSPDIEKKHIDKMKT
jgi:hypothetical protein